MDGKKLLMKVTHWKQLTGLYSISQFHYISSAGADVGEIHTKFQAVIEYATNVKLEKLFSQVNVIKSEKGLHSTMTHSMICCW